MESPQGRYSFSSTPPLAATTAGIRVVLLESDHEVCAGIRSAVRTEPVFSLVGEASDWAHCDYLLGEMVPELLIARMGSIPEYWWLTVQADPFPLVLALGDNGSLRPLDRRVIQTVSLPFEQSHLRPALLRAQSEIYTRKAYELSLLLRQYTSSSVAPSLYLASVTVDHEGKKFNLDTRTIVAIFASANYCRLQTPEANYEIRETMTNLCSRLDPTQFARIHRSVIVNIAYVVDVAAGAGGTTAVVLQDGTRLPVGPNFRRVAGELPLRKRA
jgi:two-component system LytT family response regulator